MAPVLLSSDEESYCDLAVFTFRRLVLGDARVNELFSEDEDALWNAIIPVNPEVAQLLCFWHVKEKVLDYINPRWRTKVTIKSYNPARDVGDKLTGDWDYVVHGHSKEKFEFRWAHFRGEYGLQERLINPREEEKIPKRHLFAKT